MKKTIEQLSLKNMVDIDRYLSGGMNKEEKHLFLSRLNMDRELLEDYQMVLEVMARRRQEQMVRHLPKQAPASVETRAKVARDIVGYGMLALGMVGALVLVCVALIQWMS